MTVRIEKAGPVWTIIHDRPEARNAMVRVRRAGNKRLLDRSAKNLDV